MAEMEKKVNKAMRRRRKQVSTSEEEVSGDIEGKQMRRRLSVEQATFLEKCFWSERKLECARKVHLASETGLDPKQVVVWFQNRRARWKSKKMEEEYNKIKSLHNTISVEKIHLQTEVIHLTNQLADALKQIQHLHSILNISHCAGGARDNIGGGDEFNFSQLQAAELNGEVQEHVGMENMEGMDLDVFGLFNGFV
ncbi:hypothetical protein ZOSMA_52G00940 [Zostera marina]|uniref:Homeobox-leucine zipper protein n=1 Tax=Zostera marina TaxID=29655 RepID=A0A0K9NXM9_ZOSMR|nr:hypothetical protein ZOSMA_52G00940 [Zostera marina]